MNEGTKPAARYIDDYRSRVVVLRPDQTAAIADAAAHLAGDGARGKMVRACGTGKTVIMRELAVNFGLTDRARRPIIVFCAPTIALVNQVVAEWTAQTDPTVMAAVLGVSSGAAVEQTDKGAHDTIAGANTTDPDVVAKWLVDNCDQPRLVVSTHVSMPRVVEALNSVGEVAEILFVDEAHRVAGTNSRNGVADSAARMAILHSDRFARRLFATATPRVASALTKTRAAESDRTIACMDDTALFGDLACDELTFRQGMDLGVLCRYEIVLTIVTDADLAGAASEGDHRLVRCGDGGTMLMPTDEFVSHVATHKACTEHGIRTAVAYHSLIADSKRWTAAHSQVVTGLGAPAPVVRHLDGTMPAGKREAILDELKTHAAAAPMIVSNVRVLTEGVDVPLLDAVILLSPRSSTADVVQIIGRAVRKPAGSGKEIGYVVIPVYVPELNADTADGIDQLADAGGNWQTVIDVIRQMRLVDPELDEQIKMRLRTAATGGNRQGTDDGGEFSPVVKVIGDAPVDILDKIVVRAIRDSAPGETSFADQVVEYTAWVNATAGRHPRMDADEAAERTLANRANHWRYSRRTGVLSDERHGQIEMIPGWIWDPSDVNFIANIDEYAEWVESNGRHAKHRSGDPTEELMASRCVRWRASRRSGTLSDDRCQRLEAIPGWCWDLSDVNFAAGVAEYAAWVNAAGRQPKRSAADPAERTWHGRADGWRQRRRLGSMSVERQRLIEAIPGWTWGQSHDANDAHVA